MATKDGTTLFSHDQLQVLMQLPLPGITIFVHGVNSDGEWYEAAEQGLCKGLNTRLARRNEHLKYKGPQAGQLSPAGYISELTPSGFINPKMTSKTFVQTDETFSPVIRFRWGYKASSEELQQFGKGIYLNEQDYWGGGPFANGCSSLPDLWGEGIEDELFLFLHVQHLNPTNDRTVYSCPPRPYFVLAAHRLAKLIESIRLEQADVPITIVCHSQGNMIGIAAAFLGDRMAAVTDAHGNSGRCVADTYVLCNAPYSLVESNPIESWTERHMKDPKGRRGRQTLEARTQTLAAFFQIVAERSSLHQDDERIDKRMANKAHGFDAISDRSRYGGLYFSTYGRVTLYCNPHDRVISASTVQGIGWRGMSRDEIRATGGDGTFTQRVFSTYFPVGAQGQYDYWANQYNNPKPGSKSFWLPASPSAEYSITKGMATNERVVGKVATLFAAPILTQARWLKFNVNALPPDSWKIPLEAPALPPFNPQAFTNGVWRDEFDQFYDPPGTHRNAESKPAADDPYAGIHKSKDGRTDSAQGDEQSEAALRYEDHARLRMQAKREGRDASNAPVLEENAMSSPSAEYTSWRSQNVKKHLAENIDTHATDHSTIVMNPDHAEKALAFDVAVGVCDIREEDLHKFRIAADWRFLDGIPDEDSNKAFIEYFRWGKFKGVSAYAWAHTKNGEGEMPKRIVDERSGAVLLSAGALV